MDLDASFLDEDPSTKCSVYLGPIEPMLHGTPSSEQKAQAVLGPRPITLAAFVDRADHPVLFDAVPPTFARHGESSSRFDYNISKSGVVHSKTKISSVPDPHNRPVSPTVLINRVRRSLVTAETLFRFAMMLQRAVVICMQLYVDILETSWRDRDVPASVSQPKPGEPGVRTGVGSRGGSKRQYGSKRIYLEFRN